MSSFPAISGARSTMSELPSVASITAVEPEPEAVELPILSEDPVLPGVTPQPEFNPAPTATVLTMDPQPVPPAAVPPVAEVPVADNQEKKFVCIGWDLVTLFWVAAYIFFGAIITPHFGSIMAFGLGGFLVFFFGSIIISCGCLCNNICQLCKCEKKCVFLMGWLIFGAITGLVCAVMYLNWNGCMWAEFEIQELRFHGDWEGQKQNLEMVVPFHFTAYQPDDNFFGKGSHYIEARIGANSFTVLKAPLQDFYIKAGGASDGNFTAFFSGLVETDCEENSRLLLDLSWVVEVLGFYDYYVETKHFDLPCRSDSSDSSDATYTNLNSYATAANAMKYAWDMPNGCDLGNGNASWWFDLSTDFLGNDDTTLPWENSDEEGSG
jgi:hypothetical protein